MKLGLNVKDITKGFLVAVIGAVVTGIYQALQTGALPNRDSLKTIGIAALLAGVSYLIKNFFSDTVKDAADTVATQATKQKVSANEVVSEALK